LLLRYKENSISSHQTFQFQFLSFLLHFYSQKSQTLYHFVLLFSKSQNSFSKIQKNTNFNKFAQNAHSTPISFLSPQIMHLDSSSHITPHHYPTHHHSSPKIIQNSPKNSFFFAKFQTTLSYPPLNLILHSWWPSHSFYKYPTNEREGGRKLRVAKITIFIKNSKIFISPWNFTILQPKVHKHFQQTKTTQKLTKNHSKPWIQKHNFSRKSDS